MKYYVTADIHGYFTELIQALKENNFFIDKKPHKLIICGDLFDRGKEALKLEEFINDLIKKDEVILIKGNHEDLTMDLLNNWHQKSYQYSHHHSNGTIDTVCQLTHKELYDVFYNASDVYKAFIKTPYIQTIIPKMLDYYETPNYIFTHGWIPCITINNNTIKEYNYIDNWRKLKPDAWDKARWINGMEAAHKGIIENNKTIVCGHWHSSFGHANYEGDGGEFDNNPNFSPYYGKGIIALDACTAVSRKVNCIVIED